MTTCRVEYRWSADQLLDATWSHAKNSSFRNFQFLVFAVGVLSGLFGLAFWYTELRNLSFPLVLLSLYTIFLRKPIQDWQIRRHFKRRKDQGITIAFEFTEDQVSIQSAKSKGQFKWDQYPTATQGKKGVVLYQDSDRYHWIPSSAFQSEDDYHAFLQLAKSKIQNFKVGR